MNTLDSDDMWFGNPKDMPKEDKAFFDLDTEELFHLTVTDVQEHEDGGATYSFDLSEGAKDQLAKLGLEWVLHCAAFGWDLQDALNSLKKPKDFYGMPFPLLEDKEYQQGVVDCNEYWLDYLKGDTSDRN